VDAFTLDSKPFTGNPAAICILKTALDDPSMRLIAKEMNSSVTAFVLPNKEKKNHFHLKWFTTTAELPLCRHGTLASSHILFTEKFPGFIEIDQDVLTFDTCSGLITVGRSKETPERIQMNFPQGKPLKVNLGDDLLIQLLENLTLHSKDILDIQFSETSKKLLVEVTSLEILKSIHPNMDGLLKMNFGNLNVRGIIVTSSPGELKLYDFVSRYFTPWDGVPEDPATGSSHSVLAVYWSNKLNKTKMNAFQASARGGNIRVELLSNDRVIIEGSVITILAGTLKTS